MRAMARRLRADRLREAEQRQVLAVFLLLTTAPTDRALAGFGYPLHVQEQIVKAAQAGWLLGLPVSDLMEAAEQL